MNTPFNQTLKETGEYGVVFQVNHPIVFIEGLPNVKTSEIVMFESGQQGEVFTINRGKIEVRTFSHEPVKVGTKVTRTNKLLSVPVGREMLGHAINPLGEPLDPNDQFTPPKEMRTLDARPGGISTRMKITKQMVTGVSLIDLMIPLGIGQRELIIGDRKTGKSSVLLTAIKTQTQLGVIAIYCAIGKKKSEIKKLREFFIQEKIMDKIVIVATSSYDSPSLIYQTPYAGMAIAEYFKEQGQNTLIIFDDLSTQAKFYRELSLLARRFPGRDSYPGDVFFIHSKLLERAGNFKHPKVGEVAISCLPVIEIVEGDFTGYISTNVMGITDGHLFFDTNIYYTGMRPAVNIPLSVTRVGRQTLDKLNREINKELGMFVGEYEKMQNLSHFGQELTEEVKKGLKRGEILFDLFNQPYQLTVPLPVQMVILSLIMNDIIDSKDKMVQARSKLTDKFQKNIDIQRQILEMIKVTETKTFHANVLAKKDMLVKIIEEVTQPAASAAQPAQAQHTPPPAAPTAQAPQTAPTHPVAAAPAPTAATPPPQAQAAAPATENKE